jgi:hypothetical protein
MRKVNEGDKDNDDESSSHWYAPTPPRGQDGTRQQTPEALGIQRRG